MDCFEQTRKKTNKEIKEKIKQIKKFMKEEQDEGYLTESSIELETLEWVLGRKSSL